MHRTGKYKLINLICGIFPFIATGLITLMREDSGPLQLWLSIVGVLLFPHFKSIDIYISLQIPLGFGNGVVFKQL